MKKSNFIFLFLFLISSLFLVIDCSKKSQSNTGNTSEDENKKAISVPSATPTPTFKEELRATYLRAYNGSPVKLLKDLWEIRMNLGSNMHYYDHQIPILANRPAGHSAWLEHHHESFFHEMERIKGYPNDGFWKYKKFMDGILPDTVNTHAYEVTNTDSGRNFVRELRDNCHYNEISVGSTFQSNIQYEFEIINPCIKKAYFNAWLEYNGEGGDDSAAVLNANLGDDSPFIFRGPVGGNIVLHPLSGKPMSPRTIEEIGYIKYLQEKISQKFKEHMATNSERNPGCTGYALIAPLNQTCFNGGNTLNAFLDRGYVTRSFANVADWTQFAAERPYEKAAINAVFTAIETSNETDFINATAKLAAIHPVQSQRKVVLESFPDMFVTKDFSTFQIFSSYMHFLLNCTRFH
ncbi:hypothetical protein QEJ31_01465 [Pigmentibacter sp. JX0631]|uniref:hypothetical protein n=1 Tax=Pigmentibacter sp. JX0631 TaxID=2976982 RepID=UPI00246970A6|nr:hypothetical protein [Pigmentibacter sp. JX0631]WGL60273.1 hypothetical protein QEJ31_01465 [Pigmentibacter sp. JX0631]